MKSKSIHMLIPLLSLATAITALADPRYITLSAPGSLVQEGTNTLEIKPYEIANLVSYPVLNSEYGNRIDVTTSAGTFHYYRYSRNLDRSVPSDPFDPLIVAGPARIDLITHGGTSLATFRLFPDAYPADKAAVVTPGPQGGGAVTLECSVDLINWQVATNGIYTNQPVAKFFRVRVDKIPQANP